MIFELMIKYIFVGFLFSSLILFLISHEASSRRFREVNTHLEHPVTKLLFALLIMAFWPIILVAMISKE